MRNNNLEYVQLLNLRGTNVQEEYLINPWMIPFQPRGQEMFQSERKEVKIRNIMIAGKMAYERGKGNLQTILFRQKRVGRDTTSAVAERPISQIQIFQLRFQIFQTQIFQIQIQIFQIQIQIFQIQILIFQNLIQIFQIQISIFQIQIFQIQIQIF